MLADVYLNWLNWFNFLILKGSLLVILIDCMVSHGGGHGSAPPSHEFFRTPPLSKLMSPHGATLHLKMKPPPLKSKTPFQDMIIRKKLLETVINTCVSLIKQHWKKMAEIGAFKIL